MSLLDPMEQYLDRSSPSGTASRRDFFLSLGSALLPTPDIAGSPLVTGALELTRRETLSVAGIGALTALAPSVASAAFAEEQLEGVPPCSVQSDTGTVGALSNTESNSPEASKDIPYTSVALQRLALLAASIGAGIGLSKRGIPIGAAQSEKERLEFVHQVIEEPFESLIAGAVLAPIIEEICFRWLPYNVIGQSWKVGIPAAAFFALIHNHTEKDSFGIPWGEKVIALDTIPLNQFVGGLFYWHLIRTYGINASIFAHGVNNTAAIVAAVLTEASA